MTITLYELAAQDQTIRFSPFCWRTRMSLVHKCLEFESVPWTFTNKKSTEESGYKKVPIIKDGSRWVGDSWDIAKYLDETYIDRPMLMVDQKEEDLAHKVLGMIGRHVFPAVVPITMLQVHNILDPASQKYFREVREKMFGKTLEALNSEPETGVKNLAKALEIFDSMLQKDYLDSEHPTYADYALFGVLKWADIVSSYEAITLDSPVGQWFLRVSNLHNEYALKVPTVRSSLANA